MIPFWFNGAAVLRFAAAFFAVAAFAAAVFAAAGSAAAAAVEDVAVAAAAEDSRGSYQKRGIPCLLKSSACRGRPHYLV
jgi:hypothetical protein